MLNRPSPPCREPSPAQARPRLPRLHNSAGPQVQGELDQAIAEYHEAIRLNPDRASAYNNIGLVLRSQGKPRRAAAEFREAIRLQPEVRRAHSTSAPP